MYSETKSWLALGDSYTIGEGVPLHDSYPYQTLQLLRRQGKNFEAPEIIAKTGWTTNELLAHIAQIRLRPRYDYVTLLIGVNNQYRGMSESDYASTLSELISLALEKSGNNPQQVTVISIPDWGVTPFAADRKASEISDAIDRFNAINHKQSRDHGLNYVEITEHYRKYGNLPENVVADGLHPSASIYRHWAEQLAPSLLK